MSQITTPRAFAIAAAVTLIQIVMALWLAPARESAKDRYGALCNWDCDHYRVIATQGYLRPAGAITSEDIHSKKANAVFFPGFPLLGRGVSSVTGWSADVSLVAAAQLFTLVFWVYLILWLRLLGLQSLFTSLTVFAVASYPSSFFLVTGYTESAFLAFAFGFFYWTERWVRSPRGAFALLAFLHGALCGGVRIVAFALAPYPVFRRAGALRREGLWRRLFKHPLSWLLGGSVALGSAAFFYYLHLRFGEWNLYFKLEEIGWGNHRRWFALLDPLSYLPRFFFEDTVDSLNRLSVPVIAGLLGWILYKERKHARFREEWVGLWLIAFVLFYIPVTGKAAAKMDSMVRYTLPPFIVLAALLGMKAQASGMQGLRDLAGPKKWTYGGVLIFCWAVQIWFCYRFLKGSWIA